MQPRSNFVKKPREFRLRTIFEGDVFKKDFVLNGHLIATRQVMAGGLERIEAKPSRRSGKNFRIAARLG
jgi:hypothetical protein